MASPDLVAGAPSCPWQQRWRHPLGQTREHPQKRNGVKEVDVAGGYVEEDAAGGCTGMGGLKRSSPRSCAWTVAGSLGASQRSLNDCHGRDQTAHSLRQCLVLKKRMLLQNHRTK
mmetsp:Transcript_31941/g.74793  ORF Transcript_31941/g.74793 Transcript_31941/m.74793 type:complete len:115 (-) Transcript_31941:1354-1698(-)